MKYTEKVSKRLNGLLEKTYDAEKGFKTAAEKIENTSIKNFFEERAKQRYEFGHELKEEIAQYGETPDKGGSFAGSAHRSWMNLKASVSSNNTESILEEVERGEKASLEEYNEILADSDLVLPPSTENLLKKQRDAIKNSLNTSKHYEEAVS